jgi:hypothetical protein
MRRFDSAGIPFRNALSFCAIGALAPRWFPPEWLGEFLFREGRGFGRSKTFGNDGPEKPASMTKAEMH